MARRVVYEWTVEEIDADGDIVDADFSDVFPRHAVGRVGLVRDTLDHETQERVDRQWAYLDDTGALPETFDGGRGDGLPNDSAPRVPLRFHKEIQKARTAS